MNEEVKIERQLDVFKYTPDEIYDYIYDLKEKNQSLKKQLEYLRSGEYLNQLKFEINMLEDIVQNNEVSKEDKEFIDMTHRNTELLEENHQLKDRIEKAIEYIENDLSHIQVVGKRNKSYLLKILKGEENEQ